MKRHIHLAIVILVLLLYVTALAISSSSTPVTGLVSQSPMVAPTQASQASVAPDPQDEPPPNPPPSTSPVVPLVPRALTEAPAENVSVAADLSNIYIGGMHSAHTLISDGSLQYPEEFYSTFKKYWDWISTTDHDASISLENWQNIVKSADAYNGNFVSLIGYEWTSARWGHLSVVFKGEPPPGKNGSASSTELAYDTPQKLYDYLHLGNGLAAFAHPAFPGYIIDFAQQQDYCDDDIAPLAGIFGFNDTIHWNATWDFADGTKNTASEIGTENNAGWIKNALDRGYHLGFVSELDLHQKQIDPMSYRYTGVVANSLTRDDIFQALKMRHTYAVRSPSGLGKRILLRADAGSHLMGEVFYNRSNKLRLVLTGKTDLDGFTLVNVFVNGKIVETRSVSGQNLVESFNVNLHDGNNYTFFEVRAVAIDGQVSQAITSPMYVTAVRRIETDD